MKITKVFCFFFIFLESIIISYAQVDSVKYPETYSEYIDIADEIRKQNKQINAINESQDLLKNEIEFIDNKLNKINKKLDAKDEQFIRKIYDTVYPQMLTGLNSTFITLLSIVFGIIVASLLGMGATIFFSVRKQLRSDLDQDVQTRADNLEKDIQIKNDRVTAKYLFELANAYWNAYNFSKENSYQHKSYIDLAVKQNEQVLKHLTECINKNILPKSQLSDFEELILVAKNNIAYHLAVRGDVYDNISDKERALDFASEIYHASSKEDYKYWYSWRETYAAVLFRVSEDKKDHEEAYNILKVLINYKTIPIKWRKYIEHKTYKVRCKDKSYNIKPKF